MARARPRAAACVRHVTSPTHHHLDDAAAADTRTHRGVQGMRPAVVLVRVGAVRPLHGGIVFYICMLLHTGCMMECIAGFTVGGLTGRTTLSS